MLMRVHLSIHLGRWRDEYELLREKSPEKSPESSTAEKKRWRDADGRLYTKGAEAKAKREGGGKEEGEEVDREEEEGPVERYDPELLPIGDLKSLIDLADGDGLGPILDQLDALPDAPECLLDDVSDLAQMDLDHSRQ